MGAGAYLSSKSQREVYESEVSRERLEIEEDPHEEMLELELFYQLKGFSAEEARTMAERIQKEQLLPGDTLDIAFSLDHNDHPGYGGLELSLRDFRSQMKTAGDTRDAEEKRASVGS